MTITHPRAGRGQAATELTALVAVIALMVAAIAVWLPGQQVGEPPPVIPAVARALGDDAATRKGIPAVRELLRAADRNDPLDAIARWIDRGDGWVRAVPLNRAGIEVLRGAREELRAELEAALEDPVGYGKDLVRPPSLDDLGDLLDGAQGIPGYIRELRGMRRDDAVLRLAHDAGRFATRAGLVWLRRRIGRAVLRRAAGRARSAPERAAAAP